MKIFVIGLIVCLCLFMGYSAAASDDVCEDALKRCTTDAVISGLLSGVQSFLVYYSVCLMGYSWCLKYYV